MKDYITPSLRKDLNNIILHAGTNDLILDRNSQGITTSIVNIACSMKGVKYDVSKSNIIPRTESKNLNQRGHEVNILLSPSRPVHFQKSCIKIKIDLIFIFTPPCGGSKGFIKAIKAFIKPFETPQRGVKIKNLS